ncbi:hypothetical protein ACWEP3_30650, partial [Streptomyces albidoflavus]
ANLARLGEAFPAYAAAVVGIKYDPEGVAFLQAARDAGARPATRCAAARRAFSTARPARSAVARTPFPISTPTLHAP